MFLKQSSDSWLIVGLGNIGAEYAETRHNIGFKVADALAAEAGAVFATGRYGSVAEFRHKGRTFVLLKPSTYMNLSGNSIGEAVNFYKLDPATEVIVIYDDIALEPGHEYYDAILLTDSWGRKRLYPGNSYTYDDGRGVWTWDSAYRAPGPFPTGLDYPLSQEEE